MKKIKVMRCNLLVAALVVSGSAVADGVLRYAMPDDPPTLDQQVSTSDIGSIVAHHMFEILYTFNSKSEPVPLLATGETVSNDGRRVEISLRKDVKFHNGKRMTSADVVASLKRWGEHGSRGSLLFDNLESVKADGDYKVVLKFKSSYGPWKNLLAFVNGGPTIHPAEIMNGAGKQPITPEQYIGTGPYKFNEWRQGRYIELVRFDDYAQPPGQPDGYAGRREAIFDSLRFIPTPDVNTRVSGVQAGDYDYADDISGDLFDALDADPNVKTILKGAPIFGLVFMNSSAGIFKDNYKLRRAVQTALDKSAAMKIAIGPAKLWRANGSFFPKGNVWYSDAGIAGFSPNNAEAARKLAEEANYDDQLIKFLVSTRFGWHYDTAVVYARQLLDAGFKVQMLIVDWPTLSAKRQVPEEWDMFFTHHGAIPDPILMTPMNDTYPGWWKTAEKLKLKDAFVSSTDLAERQRVWNDIQGLMYEQVPAMKTGDFYSYNIASSKLTGLEETTLVWPHFWGVSKK